MACISLKPLLFPASGLSKLSFFVDMLLVMYYKVLKQVKVCYEVFEIVSHFFSF